MNKGVAHATGEYLLFLNSGDFLEPEVIATVLNELTGTDIIYGDIIFQTTNGERQTMVYPDTLSTEYMFFKAIATRPHFSDGLCSNGTPTMNL